METMEMVILILQLGLSILFLYFGLLKLILPLEKIAAKVSWAYDYSHAKLKLFGLLEIIGAVGLTIPYRLDIAPILTPMAATGLAMVMSGAAVIHLRRDEVKMVFLNILIIFLLAGVGFHTLLDVLTVEFVR